MIRINLALFLISIFIPACAAPTASSPAPSQQTSEVSETSDVSTSPPTETLAPTATPEATATPESYENKLLGESTVRTVEVNYQGIAMKVNVISHSSLSNFRHGSFKENPLQFIDFNQKFSDGGENYQEALAHAVLQALGQAYQEGGNSATLINALKSDSNTGVPIFATDLTKFATEGYKPTETVFYPTGHSVNIVLMNTNQKDFPGDSLRMSGFNGLFDLGRALDKNGNLYIFINDISRLIAYSQGDDPNYPDSYDDAVARYVSDALESLSWDKGNTPPRKEFERILRGQTTTYQILSSSQDVTSIFSIIR